MLSMQRRWHSQGCC